jgi:hypothetical protein
MRGLKAGKELAEMMGMGEGKEVAPADTAGGDMAEEEQGGGLE